MRVLECILLQVAVVLVLCSLCDAATGGCSRYGHACWGGHDKRSSHDKLHDVGKVLDREVDAEDAAVAEAQEAPPDPEDDADTPQGEVRDVSPPDLHYGPRRPFQVARRFGLNALADFISIPRGQAFQEPETADESDEEAPRFRRRHKNGGNDLQVLIIPNEESQVPDLHIYKILGQAPRKRV